MKRSIPHGFVSVGLISVALWAGLSNFTQRPVQPKSLPSNTNVVIASKVAAGMSPAIADIKSTAKAGDIVQASLHARFVGAKDLGAAYNEFGALAVTNPDAIYYQALSSLICMNFSGGVLKSLEASVEQDPLTQVGKRRSEALGKLKTACATMPPSAHDFRFQRAMIDAASRGDPKGIAVLLGMELPTSEADYKTASKSAESLAYSRDPVVFANLGHYFERRDGLAQWQIPGVEGNTSGKEVAAAFHLFACDLGDDCSATSFNQLAICARMGQCDYRDRFADFQRNKLTPDAYDRVQRIRDVIGDGLTSRTWPIAFWIGVEKVPGTMARMNSKH